MGRLIDKDATIKEMMKDPVGKMVANKYNMGGWLEGREEVPALTLEWIGEYLSWLQSIGGAFAISDANAIKSMLKKWEMEQRHSKCGPDYCEIGGTHD